MNTFIICIGIFTICEVMLLVLKRSKQSSIKSSADKMSLQLFWISIPICFTIGGFLSATTLGLRLYSPVLEETGIAVFAIGFIIRWLAVLQLGAMFTVDVSISKDHVLKTNGFYSVVRHPSYFGLLLIIAGIAMLFGNWLSVLVVTIPLFLVTNYRISVEENALIAEFGGQYEDYKKRVKKIIPVVY